MIPTQKRGTGEIQRDLNEEIFLPLFVAFIVVGVSIITYTVSGSRLCRQKKVEAEEDKGKLK